MLLAVDAGNTNTKFAVYDGDEQRGIWRISNEPNRTADEYAVWLLQLMQLQGLRREAIDAVIVGSVVPASLFNLMTLARRYFRREPLVVGDPRVRLGMRVLTLDPAEVGADRIVAAVAAHGTYGGAVIVIDFGTATTFDVVDAAGDYLGGIIAPGVNLSIEALHRAAAKLPMVGVERPGDGDRVLGRSTIQAMQSGVYWGYVGLVEGLVTRLKKEQGGEMKVVATGGLSSLFADATDMIDHVDKDLTLRGLLEVYRRNAV
ncbi:MAG: type III pantothenate kinase [Alphaproteobacteria bacterium]